MKVRLHNYTQQLYEFLVENEEPETLDCALFERLVKRAKKQVLKKSAKKSKTLADVKKEKEDSKKKEDEKDKKEEEPKITFNTSSEPKKNTKDEKIVNLGPINNRLLKKLVELMRKGPVRFSYNRKDKQRRNAIGTLEPDVVRKHIKGTGKPKPPTVLPYLDLTPGLSGAPNLQPNYNRAAWRSFRKDLLQSIKLSGM